MKVHPFLHPVSGVGCLSHPPRTEYISVIYIHYYHMLLRRCGAQDCLLSAHVRSTGREQTWAPPYLKDLSQSMVVWWYQMPDQTQTNATPQPYPEFAAAGKSSPAPAAAATRSHTVEHRVYCRCSCRRNEKEKCFFSSLKVVDQRPMNWQTKKHRCCTPNTTQDTVAEMAKDLKKRGSGATSTTAAELYEFIKKVCVCRSLPFHHSRSHVWILRNFCKRVSR